MPSEQRRKFLSYSAALFAGGWLTGCSDGTENPAFESGHPGDGSSATSSTNLVMSHEIAGPWTFAATSDNPFLSGAQLASADSVTGMSPATVPGTILNTMIVNGKYSDPFYRNIVTDTVPDSLKDTDYWYRTPFTTPPLQPGQRVWLRFEGVNYMAAIWLNGAPVGTLEGAFKHGCFDVTRLIANGGGMSYLAILVVKLDFSEDPVEPDYASGVSRGQRYGLNGRNGGPTGATLRNGPTFFCTAGWDWLPTIPDRNLGIWQPVSWFTTGAVRIADVRVDSTLSDDLDRATLRLDLSLDNRAGAPIAAIVRGKIGNDISFRHAVAIPAADQTMTITLTAADVPELSLSNPQLWWPNGYGESHLYTVSVSIELQGQVSDMQTFNIGLRHIEYSRSIGFGSQLSITVNKLPILVMGGNWGLDEALKRIPRERLFNQVRLHRDANLNLIRNWNGQSTSRDFFDACDAYGILVWQEFFYSTEAGGSGPENVPRDLANIRDIIIHNRNHPSILLWCGGNEGSPPTILVNTLEALVKELDPKRLCLTSSASDTGADAVNGYSSGGPYHWQSPRTIFDRGYGTSNTVPFHNEVGSYSIPTLEFVQKMLPPSSWEHPDDFWADRDINSTGLTSIYFDGSKLRWGGDGYIATTSARYGKIQNLADFVRKSQLMNYESIRSIYEATAAVMLGPVTGKVTSPSTGVIMWMTNPAHPSFIWQMYSHDLEQHSSFFAVQRSCRRVNVILDAKTFDVTVANHTANPVSGNVGIRIYNLDSTLAGETTQNVGGVRTASHQIIANIGTLIASAKSDVCIVVLDLLDAGGTIISDNFYWCQTNGEDVLYTALDTMNPARIAVSASTVEIDGITTRITASVENIGNSIALMTHLQLFNQSDGQRILPAFYSDNYLNLLPGTCAQVVIDVPHMKEQPLCGAGLRIDGWKLDRTNSKLGLNGVPVTFNEQALEVARATGIFDRR